MYIFIIINNGKVGLYKLALKLGKGKTRIYKYILYIKKKKKPGSML
jgi:hypothetical protein